jgi:hypothetical protein
MLWSWHDVGSIGRQAIDPTAQAVSLLRQHVAIERSQQCLTGFVGRTARQKAQSAQVHAQNRYRSLTENTRAVQHGAVST